MQTDWGRTIAASMGHYTTPLYTDMVYKVSKEVKCPVLLSRSTGQKKDQGPLKQEAD